MDGSNLWSSKCIMYLLALETTIKLLKLVLNSFYLDTPCVSGHSLACDTGNWLLVGEVVAACQAMKSFADPG